MPRCTRKSGEKRRREKIPPARILWRCLRPATRSSASPEAEPKRCKTSSSCPFRCALVEESVHAFLKITAHVAGEDHLVIFGRGHSFLDAAHGLLRGAQSERSPASNCLRQLTGARLQRGVVGQHFAQ